MNDDIVGERVKQVECGVPWCIALCDKDRQYCRVHDSHAHERTVSPPPVSRELVQRFMQETGRKDS